MKRYFYLAATLLLGLTFASCESSNTPGKSEKTSLPAIVRSIKDLSKEDAGKKLADLKFASRSDDDVEVWMYPAEIAAATDEKDLVGKEYMYVYFDDTEEMKGIEGGHALTSAKDALDTYKTWEKYLAGEISKPAVWMAIVSIGDEEKYYMDGSLIDTYRDAMLATLDAYLKADVINQDQYDEYAAMYKSTHADYTKFLAGLKESDEFVVEELYVETDGAEKKTGTVTFSYFENVSDSEYGHFLEHAVMVGDVSEILDYFSTDQSAVPAKAPKFHFQLKKK